MGVWKKAISWLITAIMLLGLAGSLSGCGKDSENNNSITQGKWLSMINETFGMYSYDSDQPYLKSVKKNNQYFADVQIAYEWGLIDEDAFELEKSINKDFVARTLVQTVGKKTIKDMSAHEITAYASNEGYVVFSYAGKNDGKHLVTRDEAIMSLGASKEKWLEADYEDKSVLESKEDVVNLPEQGLNALDCEYSEAENCLKIPEEYAKDLEEGSVYIAPAMSGSDIGMDHETPLWESDNRKDENSASNQQTNQGAANDNANNAQTGAGSQYADGYDNETKANTGNAGGLIIKGNDVGFDMATAHKADRIKRENGYAYIYNSDEDIELEDAVEQLEFSGSNIAPDFSVMPVVDAMGNKFYANSGPTQQSYVVCLDSNGQPLSLEQEGVISADTSVSGELEVNDKIKVKLEVKEDSVSASFEYTAYDNEKGKKLNASYSQTYKNFSSDVYLNLFDLKNAAAVAHFDTEINGKIKASYENNQLFAPAYSNGNGKFFSNFSRAVMKRDLGKDTYGAKSIKICSIPLVGHGPAYLGLDVKLRFGIDGSISLSSTIHSDLGVKCNNGKLQMVKEFEQTDFSMDLKAKAEAKIGVGFSANLAGKSVASVEADYGIGCDFEQNLYLASPENELLETCSVGTSADDTEAFLSSANAGENHVDACYDIKTYRIFEIGLADDCLVAKWGLKDKLTYTNKKDVDEIFGFPVTGHFEDGKKVAQCTRNYEEPQSEQVMSGDLLQIDKTALNMKIGQEATVKVSTIPEGYNLSDVKVESSDPAVAEINENGTVKAVGVGTTIITYSIPDTAYSQSCAVKVQEDGVVSPTFVPLPDAPVI